MNWQLISYSLHRELWLFKKNLITFQIVKDTSFFEAIEDCFKTIQYIKVLGVNTVAKLN